MAYKFFCILLISLLYNANSAFADMTFKYTPDTCNEIRSQIPLPPDIPKIQIPALTYQPLKVVNTKANLGIGHLYPDSSDVKTDWQKKLKLPVFSKPGSKPSAWIINGWFIATDKSKVTPFTSSGMVETSAESPAFIVYKVNKNGWINFRHSPGPEGTAWTHNCLITSNSNHLSYKSWEDHLKSKSPLYFRAITRHSLREEPSVSSKRLRWIPAYRENYHFTILEIRDDWMQVELTIPSDHCSSKQGVDAKKYKGWVKWRDEVKGPWVWYYTKGC